MNMNRTNLGLICGAAGCVLGASVMGSLKRDNGSDSHSSIPLRANYATTAPAANPSPENTRPAGQVPPENRTAARETRTGYSQMVTINGQRISDEQLRMLEQSYRTPVPDGDFWYDRQCGAWGVAGGPTAGFMMAGMNLGGPLRADASNGNTGVFINGRELHRIDVLALLTIYPTLQRGRGWMDAYGNWGFEGGPAIDNIWAAAARMGGGGGGGGQREGILSGYDKTGIAVYGY